MMRKLERFALLLSEIPRELTAFPRPGFIEWSGMHRVRYELYNFVSADPDHEGHAQNTL